MVQLEGVHEVFAINSFGQVIGNRSDNPPGPAPVGEPFFWTPTAPNGTNGSLVHLSASPGEFLGHVTAINSTGQVVGNAYGPDIGFPAFLWTPTTPNGNPGSWIDLGALPGVYTPIPRGINNFGQVVGDGSMRFGPRRAFLWTPDTANGNTGSMIDLGDLPGVSGSVYVAAINSYGQVVGSIDVIGRQHAFLWTPATANGTSGFMIHLGDLPGGSNEVFPYAINSVGQVVGFSRSSTGARAFLWTPSTANGTEGTMIDVQSLLGPNDGTYWDLGAAYGINDHGQIVGDAMFDPDGVGPATAVRRAFLLTPVPETTSLALLLTAALVASCRRPSHRMARKASTL